MGRDGRIPVILAVDVEPDPRLIEPGRPLPWSGYEAAHAYLSAMRPRIAEATGSPVHYCWYFRMDPQVALVYGSPAWAARHYDDIVDAQCTEGDEFGLHQHALRWDTAAGSWVCDHADQPWVEHCVEMGFEAFAGHFGYPCPSFRFGDHWMNNDTLRLVERLGARADLTLEPGMPAAAGMVSSERNTGSLPDYRGVPHGIYRPQRGDYRRPDTGQTDGIWMVPVTTGQVRRRARGFKARFRRLLQTGWARTHTVSLNLAVSPATFQRVVAQRLTRDDAAHLAMVVRSDAAIRPRFRAHMEANLEFFLRDRQSKRFVFSTVQETLDALVVQQRAAQP